MKPKSQQSLPASAFVTDSRPPQQPTVTLIVLSGLPGVGKTTIARELAVVLGAMHVRIDSIEQALRNGGMAVYDEGYRVAYAVAEDNLRLGRIVIADCVNPWPLTRNEWHAVANRALARVVSVELVCSDLDEHKRRVEARMPDIAHHRLPTWSEVMAHDYRPWDTERLVIDTAWLTVPQSVQTILSESGLTLTSRQAAD
jgi:predicted kinase